jgi:hypothetical protein
MKNFDVFVWSSDFEEFTGEGLLARSFIKTIYQDKDVKIKIISNTGIYFINDKKIYIKNKSKYENNFLNKYLKIFFGIALIWIHHFKKKKIIYLNYLPLWNFFIFILLPRNTVLGPITGGIHYNINSVLSKIVRNFFFPIFYKLSIKVLFYKYNYAFFSTDMLKKYVPKKKHNRCVFNLAILTYRPTNNKKIIKKIDFFFYYKKHPNKSNDFIVNIINLLLLKKYKIYVVGDFMNVKGIKNLGYINKNQILYFLKQSKFTINSGENFLSLFAIDSYASNTIVFYNSILKHNFDFLDFNFFIPLNFNNLNQAYKKILKVYSERKYFQRFNDRLIINKSQEVKNDFLNYLLH